MTSEQQALLQKEVRSLEAAKVLNREGLPEFAVTRAYYTMFYIVEAFLEGDNLSFSKHSAVISAFGQRFANTGRVPVEFHRYLITAEQIRRQGDYDTTPELTEVQAAEQILRAEQFLELAAQMLES
ncbi:HEPN domain-containing protein [Phormidesmis sp. 146-12]